VVPRALGRTSPPAARLVACLILAIQVDEVPPLIYSRCRSAALVLSVLVVMGACSADTPNEGPRASTGEAAVSPSPTDFTPEKEQERCRDPATRAEIVELVAGDKTVLAAAHAGSGRVGVILGHQYPNDLCDWWSYLGHLADSGFNVLAIDFRCYGESACPEGNASGDLLADIEGAIKYLRSTGATKVFYMGASMGGTVAFAAGSRLSSSVDGAINLSGGGDFTTLTQSPFVDAPRFAPGVDVPFLSVAARGDLPGNMLRRDFEAVPAADKQLVMLPAISGHGVSMLYGEQAGEWSRLDRTIQSWLRERS
jgi:pimeloyl-ACP methyl ester carboxylesterase